MIGLLMMTMLVVVVGFGNGRETRFRRSICAQYYTTSTLRVTTSVTDFTVIYMDQAQCFDTVVALRRGETALQHPLFQRRAATDKVLASHDAMDDTGTYGTTWLNLDFHSRVKIHVKFSLSNLFSQLH